MNENINIVDILKDTPKETKLWSPICGECELVIVDTLSEYPIKVSNGKDGFLSFLSDGRYVDCIGGECLLFPSKDNRDWSTFKAPWKHKSFEPFQKVLISGIMDNVYYWSANFYSHYDKKHRVHYLIDGETINDDDYIISYEGNEDKLSKRI